jgi:hypothetical protein
LAHLTDRRPAATVGQKENGVSQDVKVPFSHFRIVKQRQ